MSKWSHFKLWPVEVTCSAIADQWPLLIMAFTSGRRAQNESSEWNGQKSNIIVNLRQMYATGAYRDKCMHWHESTIMSCKRWIETTFRCWLWKCGNVDWWCPDDCLEVFSFSIMQSPFGVANVEILTVRTTSFIQLWTFENGWACLCRGKETWCDVCFGK